MVTDSTNGTGVTPASSGDADATSSDSAAERRTQLAQTNGQPGDTQAGDEPVVVARQVAQAGDQSPLLAMLPQAGEWVIIKVEPGSAVQLPVDLAQFTGHTVHGNLELTLPNGGVVVLEGFVAAANSGTPPELLTAEGKPIDLAEFLVAVGVAPEALHVATHEAPPPPTPDHAGHFTDGPGPQILGGLTPIGALAGTDLNFPTEGLIQHESTPAPQNFFPEEPRDLEFSVTDATVTEGQVAVFTVSYTGDTLAPGQTATVHVATGPGFTTTFPDATAGSDYTPVGFDLTFTGGQPTALTVGVTTIDDTIVEPNEDYTLVLSSPSTGTIVHSPGDGVIIDNDASNLHWSITADTTVTEGQTATYTVGYTGATLASGVAETQDVYVDDQRKITEETQVSWNSVTTSHANVIELQKTVQANIATRDAYIKQFDIGQRGLLDLLNEDNELYLSKDNLVTATFAETFARFRLLAVAGGLEKALSVMPPDQAAVPVEQ
jgi:hypothetical protein